MWFFVKLHYSKTMQTDKKFRYPLGGDLYAYVNTRRRDGVKIHIRHFQLSMDTKGGVKPTSKGVKMDAKTLRRLFAMKKQLTEEFKLQQTKVKNQEIASSGRQDKKKKKKKQKSEPPEEEEEEDATRDKELRQRRTWPVYPHDETTQNVNNYPAAFLDVGALTPSYSSTWILSKQIWHSCILKCNNVWFELFSLNCV